MKRLKVSWFVITMMVALVHSYNGYCETFAYVPDSAANTVGIISLSNESITATVETGNAPYGAAIFPYGNYGYITNSGSNSVTIVDFSEINDPDDVVLATISVGKEPRGVAVDPFGYYVYVANYESDTISIINTISNTVTSTVSSGDGPWGIFADPDGETVYVSNYLDDSISVVSATSAFTISDAGDGPVGLSMSSDGKYLYVANHDGNMITRIETSKYEEKLLDDFTITGRVSVGAAPFGIVVSPDDDYIFVSNSDDNTVSVINAESLTIEATLDVGDTPMGIAVPKHGDAVYVACFGDGKLQQIRIDNLSVTDFDFGGVLESPVALGAFIGGMAPDAPTNLDIEDYSDTWAELEWEDNSWDELGFIIERKIYDDDDDDDDDENEVEEEYEVVGTVGANITEFRDTGLDNSEKYAYRIRAYNEAADSMYSYETYLTTMTDESSTCFINSLFGLF